MTVQCCKCKKVRSFDTWEHPKTQVQGQVSHTYCPSCLHETRRAIRQETLFFKEALPDIVVV